MRILIILICLFLILHLSATIVNIPDDQPTIQDGINVSVDGDTVLVQPGTYLENINYNGKNITVGSLFLTTLDTTYISSTTIDGNQNGTVVIFENGESTDAILCGFKIMNGMKLTTMTSGGGGVYIHNSNPHLHNLIISSNFATSGAGIYIHDASPILNNMIIIDNEVPVGSGHGGGLYLMNCDDMIIKNLSIIHNETGMMGSGLFLIGCESLIFENLIVSNNECSGFGSGALYFIECDVIILNSTICYNNNQYSGGGLINGENVHLVNSIVYGNSEPQLDIEYSADYCLIQGGFPGIGNIDTDPLFTNAFEGDFHLQDSSPCIGAGIDQIEIGGIIYFAPEYDLEGNSRPFPVGSMPDIGCYENIFGEPQVGIEQDELNINNSELKISNYPNPFNPNTEIFFTAKDAKNAKIEIFNIKGQKIKTLSVILSFIRQGGLSKDKGNHSIIWNGTDNNDKPVGSGVYLYKLKVNGKTEAVKKCLLLK